MATQTCSHRIVSSEWVM